MFQSEPPQDDHAGSMEEATTLRTLNAFAVDLIAIPSVEDLFWYVAQNVVGPLNFVDCVIYQANEEQTELVQVAALGEKNPYGRSIVNPLKIPFGQGITGKAAQGREPIIIDDLLKDSDYIPDTQPARSEICVPLICGNRVIGVIDSEHPDTGAFGPAELEILITIAAMTSAKLELLAEADRSKQRYLGLVEAHAQLNSETTNRKALEAELFSARKLEAIGRLTGRFAHEFNNILTVISGNLDLLRQTATDPQSADILEDAQTGARRGAGLIAAMLTFSQRTRLTPQAVDLNALVAQSAKDEAVELTLQAGLSLVSVDLDTVTTVLSNLIANARDAMPNGEAIEITTEEVTHNFTSKRALVTSLRPGRYVRLSVRDNGPGIPPETLQQVFDPFYSTKPAGGGTGLGLSMALGFMQQSGGTVGVTSQVGDGSTFQLYFPVIS